VQRTSIKVTAPSRIVNNKLYSAKLPAKIQLSVSSTTKQNSISAITVLSESAKAAYAVFSLASISLKTPVVKIEKASTTSTNAIATLQEGAVQLQIPESIVLFYNVKHITELTTIIENNSDQTVYFKIDKKQFSIAPHSQLIIPARIPLQSFEAAISEIIDETTGREYKFANGVLTLVYKYVDFEIPLHRLKEFKKAHSSMSPFYYPYRV